MAEPPAPTLPPPGWYDDPNDPNRHRYWDGDQGTDERRDKPQQLGNGWFVLAVLIPISAIVLAIIEWSRGNTGRGFAFFGAGFLAFLVITLVTCGLAVDEYDQCIEEARNLNELSKC